MKVGFIGAGKMAEAIIASLINSKLLESHMMFISDINADRRKLLKKRYRINVYSNNHLLVSTSDVIFLAVKPQDITNALQEICGDITSKKLVISIVAGKTILFIENLLPKAKLIRVMPNIATLVSEGMSVFCTGSRTTAMDKKNSIKLLSCFGKVLELPEEQFDAVTALSGSGPAFFSFFLDNMVNAAICEGINKENALLLAEQTMLGTSRILMEKNIDPKNLIKAVASAKGTTSAGLDVLRKSEIPSNIRKTIKAAVKRSKELSKASTDCK